MMTYNATARFKKAKKALFLAVDHSTIKKTKVAILNDSQQAFQPNSLGI